MKGRIKYTHFACQAVLRPVETPWVSVLVAKLTALIYGDFYCQQQELKQKRLPWQEAAFNMVNKLWQAIADKSAIWFKYADCYSYFSLRQHMFYLFLLATIT